MITLTNTISIAKSTNHQRCFLICLYVCVTACDIPIWQTRAENVYYCTDFAPMDKIKA